MRGEIWTVASAGCASKPRPAVVIQSDETNSFDSTIVCLLTSDASIKGSTRVRVSPSETNGLAKDCYVMADKVLTLKKSSLGKKIGTLANEDMKRVYAALRSALGI